jgi:hypothetical protein
MIYPGDPGEDRITRAIGLLSPDVFVNYDLDLDFGSDKLNFFQQDHCDGAVIYWQPSAIAVIPFELNSSNHIRFPVALDGIPLTAVLDTGAYHTVLNRNVAERELGLDFAAEGTEQVGVLGDDGDEIYSRQFQSLSVEGIEVSNPTLDILPDLWASGLRSFFGMPTAGDLPDVIVGMSALSQLHVDIAYGEKKLYITEAVPASNSAQ